jgi:hypothetical protein
LIQRFCITPGGFAGRDDVDQDSMHRKPSRSTGLFQPFQNGRRPPEGGTTNALAQAFAPFVVPAFAGLVWLGGQN